MFKNISNKLMFPLLTILILSLFWGFQYLSNAPSYPQDVEYLKSVSFSPNQANANPVKGDVSTYNQIYNDMKTVHRVTDTVRTYTVSQNMDMVPEIADSLHMKVILGVWVDNNEPTRTKWEFNKAIELAKTHKSVISIIVGNETLLTKTTTVDELDNLMILMHKETGKPVSSGEPWDIWIKHPSLVASSQFIAAHILPFWENVPASNILSTTINRYDQLHTKYPNSPIMVAEFGFPSARFNRGPDKPSLKNEANLVRNFASYANKNDINYNIIEAFDQPWKTNEGNVGPYWGIFNAHRDLKFPLNGLVYENKNWVLDASIESILGVLISSVFLLNKRKKTLAEKTGLVALGQFFGYFSYVIFVSPFLMYNNWLQVGFTIFMFPLLFILLLTSFDKLKELNEVVFGKVYKNLNNNLSIIDTKRKQKLVSIHIPSCNEKPELVIRTLRSLKKMNYHNYEVLVIVNNTKDKSLVRPIEEECIRLGRRFKFIEVDGLKGFKAGALNYAVKYMHKNTDIIGVIDADYVVSENWLKDLVGSFNDKNVALVQAPQEHINYNNTYLQESMNDEYSNFFDVGMVQRNEDNAIIVHGTMLLIQKDAFLKVGQWNEKYICEDTELGLRLHEAGYTLLYTNKRYGFGVLPDNMVTFQKQRYRWAFGAMKIMQGHFFTMFSFKNKMTFNQRYHYLMGWLHWISEALGVGLTLFNVIWATIMLTTKLGVPPPEPIMVATIFACFINVIHMLVTSDLRTSRKNKLSIFRAALVGVGLQITIAKAIFYACFKDEPFIVTLKGGKTSKNGFGFIYKLLEKEIFLMLSLWFLATIMMIVNHENVRVLQLFSSILYLESIPLFLNMVPYFIENIDFVNIKNNAGYLIKNCLYELSNQFVFSAPYYAFVIN
jgi:cellulose synthase/poly-beta-1,6-N-acetylglucosamine synthase-like glycosyltransferase/exo-beta-1,3-glucanase (GH17 family)